MRANNSFHDFLKRAKQTLRLGSIYEAVTSMFSRPAIDPPIPVPRSGGVRDESKAMRRYRLKRKARNKQSAASRRLNWSKAALLVFLFFSSTCLAEDKQSEDVAGWVMAANPGYACSYTYEPKEDITAYELARLMPLFFQSWDSFEVYKKLPEGSRRHLKPSSDNCK